MSDNFCETCVYRDVDCSDAPCSACVTRENGAPPLNWRAKDNGALVGHKRADEFIKRLAAGEGGCLAHDDPNPKKLYGDKKPGVTGISPVATFTEAFAAELGAAKYGPYNWRNKPVNARTYLDAIYRHLALWQLGEENDDQTGVSHLGNIRSCAAILLDAAAVSALIDDRPKNEAALAELKRLFALKATREI